MADGPARRNEFKSRPMTRVGTLAGCMPLAAVLLIVYGSLLPFEFSPARFRQALSAEHFGFSFGVASFEDCAVNVAVYVAFAAAATFYFVRTGRSVAFTFGFTVFAGCALSACMEVLQLALPARVSSIADVTLNATGSVMGAIIGTWLRCRLDTDRIGGLLHGSAITSERASCALAVGLLLYHLAPFDFVSDTAQLHASLAEAAAGCSAHIVFDPSLLLSGVPKALWFFLYGCLLAGSVRKVWSDPIRVCCVTVAHCAAFCVTVEVMQLFTVSHTPDLPALLLQLGAAVAGALVVTSDACAAGSKQPAPRRYLSQRIVAAVLFVFLLSASLSAGESRQDFEEYNSAAARTASVLPFERLWRQSALSAATDVFADSATYAGLAGALLLVLASMPRATRCAAVLIVCVAMACTELLVGFCTKSQTTDSSVVPIAALAAWIVMSILPRVVPDIFDAPPRAGARRPLPARERAIRRSLH